MAGGGQRACVCIKWETYFYYVAKWSEAELFRQIQPLNAWLSFKWHAACHSPYLCPLDPSGLLLDVLPFFLLSPFFFDSTSVWFVFTSFCQGWQWAKQLFLLLFTFGEGKMNNYCRHIYAGAAQSPPFSACIMFITIYAVFLEVGDILLPTPTFH